MQVLERVWLGGGGGKKRGNGGRERKGEAPGEGGSIEPTHGTDEARVVPAVAQGLQEAIAGVNLEVTAMAFGAEHLLVVCGDKGGTRRVR